MRLQSLEIIGFKSFATKTTLQFHRGVTAVVGPNGCGKSNILDAIRWVLGEQSAKALRGGEMADVIFSGADTRERHNMAEVSLTFGDCEKELDVPWNELCITRRVFRDGKSEYLMNGTACRLKDIHQLFMDTGIGRSAYSIMEQGKLDQILSSRPDDRRAIFEEAAGITKFKSQKREALRKLEYTESNLIRVTDIIKEVKRQIGSLQRQAGKARRYQELRSDLCLMDTHLSHRNYQHLERSIQELSSLMEQTGEARAQREREIAAQEESSAGLREQLTEIDLSIDQTRDTMQTLRNRIFSGESRRETHRDRVIELEEMLVRARTDRDSCVVRRKEQQEEMEQADVQLNQLLEVLRGEEAQLEEGTLRFTRAQQERLEAERSIDTMAGRLHAFENRLADLRGRISVAGGRRDANEQRLRELQLQQSGMREILITLKERAAEAAAIALQTEEALTAAREALEAAQQAYEAAQRERQKTDRDYNELSKQLAECNSRREILSQLEREGEGLGEGTQALLRGLNRPDFFQAGILGTLVSLMEVPTDDIPALEAALADAGRSVVFKDRDIAEAALQRLKEGALGRAAVVAVDGPNRESAQEELPEGALSWAADLVKASEPVQKLVTDLLQGVVVVDNLETAFRLKQQHPLLSFAARTGELIDRHGVAYGGGGKEGEASTSALLRRSQIAALEQELIALRHEESRLAAARDSSVAAVEEASEALKERRERLHQAQSTLATAQGDNRLAAREFQETERRQEMLVVEITTLEEQLQQLEEQSRGDQVSLEQLTQELASLRQERSAAQARIVSLRELEDAAAAALAEIRLRVATERQRQQALTQQRGPIASRLRELAETIAARERDQRDYEQKKEMLIKESDELSVSIGRWKEELGGVEKELAALSSEREGWKAETETIELGLRQFRKDLLELQEKRSRDEVKVTELRMRREAIRDHVLREHQQDLSTFQPGHHIVLQSVLQKREKKIEETPPSSFDPLLEESHREASEPIRTLEGSEEEVLEIPWEKVEAIVASLTERLNAMGPVNLEAIEEFEELEQRYQFLEQQNSDLIHAKKELLEVITRINRTTKELFATTFEQIRLNFQEMFSELFGGGKANLLLVDDTDPLESGIEIIARPPGKQLQSISLLSGGERTMTAVALLFSIYMVKPSPFCVLDEMDAPLDESNIGRFIKLLDRFVDQSQFLVITHNKRTMSRADTLYGVTMEERGVTKLLSVKFHGKEKQEQPNGV
jgi:chromosome segregation protein